MSNQRAGCGSETGIALTAPTRHTHTHRDRRRTHDDAVAERGPVLELQGLEDVPKLLRHGWAGLDWVDDSFACSCAVEVQSSLERAGGRALCS